ncbi:MAG: hypothetical protein HFI29_00675 [Lachnospiraceae bacterium]|nr:hypothetical protein [Lachnospiraceae bacterium]
MKRNDLFICEHFSYLQESSIVIYGTGYWGKQVYEILKKMNAHILGVCNTEKVDSEFNHYPILSIRDVKEKYDKPEVLMIIASMDYHKEMLKNCENQNFLYAHICSVYAFYQSVFIHYEHLHIPQDLRMEITYNLLLGERRAEYQMKLYALDMLVEAAGPNHIFIYQPGKVGSQSVWKSIGGDCIQIHSLVIPFGFQEFPREQLTYYLSKIRRKKLKIITGVREPIARDLAAMFQNSDIDLWPYHQFNSNIFWLYGDFLGNDSKKLEYSELIKRIPRWKDNLESSFFELSNIIMEYKLDEFSWFLYEIKRVFGIDVFQEPFDKEKGYGIIRKGNVEILIYKLEALNNLEGMIGDFLERDGFQLKRENLSEEKIYSAAYYELKNRIKISKQYFQYYYNNNLAYLHFYTEEEISRYKKIWEERIDAGM